MYSEFTALECAACDVIQILKQIEGLEHTKLSVIGGLALWHYLPDYRPTDNINFLTNISTSPSSVKKKLLERPNSPFVQRSQVLFYQSSGGREVQVDISPEWLSPYLPDSAQNLHEIPYGSVPYISRADLVVFKLDSSGLRSNPMKKERDARDAAALLDDQLRKLNGDHKEDDAAAAAGKRKNSSNSKTSPKPPTTPTPSNVLELNPKQQQVVEEALCDVAKCGTREKGWWSRYLGLESSSSSSGKSTDQEEEKDAAAAAPKGRQRPHASSDAAIYRPTTETWFYQRLDRAHVKVKRFHSFTGVGRSSSKPTAAIPKAEPQPPARPGVARAASYAGYSASTERWWRECGARGVHGTGVNGSGNVLSTPKTDNASYWGYASPVSTPGGGGGSPHISRSNSTTSNGSSSSGPAANRKARAGSTSADSGYGGSECGGDDINSSYGYSMLDGGKEDDGAGGYFAAKAGNSAGRLGTVTEHEVDDGPKACRPAPVKRSVTFSV
ncbi:hypothetical protein F4780DRAFT_452546 [Xylariomycetidae sp. FL0641]|nr:hypothetical protein F4780DRAFT_452546 [Xylariomycetidae sp. FL0641]